MEYLLYSQRANTIEALQGIKRVWKAAMLGEDKI